MKMKEIAVFAIASLILFGCSHPDPRTKLPNVAGGFYPADAQGLSQRIDQFFSQVDPEPVNGEIFALISPHAGYDYSGKVAAYGYKSIRGKDYKTVVVIGPTHHFGFNGVSVYGDGQFLTPLGPVEVDQKFSAKLLEKDGGVFCNPEVFEKEHSIEVQIPFLQKALGRQNWKIVPVIMGNCSLSECEKLADLLKAAIGTRRDVLIVASTDMYHGYDYEEEAAVDSLTLSALKDMDAVGLYAGITAGKLQLCGGLPVVTVLLASKKMGHSKIILLNHDNSADVTGNKIKGQWTVGYCSMAIDNPDLNKEQRKLLLKIARETIESYLKTGKRPRMEVTDPKLRELNGAFVTLKKNGQLRGCIGNMNVSEPLYLTISDMAIEAAVADWRFPPVELSEMKDIEIEISVLSVLKRVYSSDEIILGLHGVVIKKGPKNGVFLPQVATETNWTKEEFLAELCSQKAGLPPDAWKDTSSELYVFTAEVFSEKNY